MFAFKCKPSKLRRDLRPNIHWCFYNIILIFYQKKSLVQNFLWCLHQFLQSYEVIVLANIQNISFLVFFAYFLSILWKKPFTQFEGCLNHFSSTYKFAKFWMIKLCLSQQIHKKLWNLGCFFTYALPSSKPDYD